MMIMGEWAAADWLMMLAMWIIMMIGMMLPSALPMILMFQLITSKRNTGVDSRVGTAMFILGYLLAWSGFSALATALQWWLQQSALLTPMLEPRSSVLSGAILVGAGVYQWLPLKNSCLVNCRSPVEYLSQHWRQGHAGSLIMGLHHGIYCLGCCWVLMLLLFAGGVMNLLLVAAITLFVLLEKVLPANIPISRASGVLLAGWGAWLLLFS